MSGDPAVVRRLLLAIALIAGSCSGGTDAECLSFADDTISMLQGAIDKIDTLELDFDTPPASVAIPSFDEFRLQAAAIQAAANDAGCDNTELEVLITERMGRLEAQTDFGRALIIDLEREGFAP